MYPRNINNPNGFPINPIALRNAIAFVKRTIIVFGMHVNSEATLRGNTFINPASILARLKNLVIRWKKGDRVGVGNQYVRLAYQLGLTIERLGVLAAPANLESLVLTDTTVDLVWDGSAGATNYILQRSDTIDFTIATQIYSGADTEFQDTGLTAETTYFYRVKAQKTDFTDSSWSNVFEVETAAA